MGRVDPVVVPWVGARARAGQEARDRVADPAAVRKRAACGPELAMMAARLLSREWLPALRGEPLAGAASRRKKSFSGFWER